MEETPETSAPQEVFDRERALAMQDGNFGLLAEMATLFLDDYPILLSAIRASIQRDDAGALSAYACVPKSSAANLGALSVFEHAQDLERIGKENSLHSAREVCDNLDESLANLKTALGSIERGKMRASTPNR
jgi:HPt (histidine-containing phosphotransfer) domain-containing protein